MSDEELPPSKLGTKQHWDEVYEREVRIFEDVGDEGEVWFGESSIIKMRRWAEKHLPRSLDPIRILECGSGNGTLLLSFLTSPSTSTLQPYHLTGIDYSPLSLNLSTSIQASRQAALLDDPPDDEIFNPVEIEWRTADLLRHDFAGETWDLVLDKGTFDALALSDEPIEEEGGKMPSAVYPEKVARLVKKGGFFLITSCNFTEEEAKRRWTKEGLGLEYHSSVPHPAFAFGGKSGTTLCTVAFQKVTESSVCGKTPDRLGAVMVNGSRHADFNEESLYVCVDCGGTKTDVAIASASGEIVARADGGTGNMAENMYYSCDTKLDQDRMKELLVPFFGLSFVPVLNDAHLLGGALLTHHCPWGIAVIAGTGSVVIALEVDGNGDISQIGRRGGAGYLLGDDGSAFDLGRCAIRLAIDDADAGSEVEGGLAGDIRDHFDVRETAEVLAKVYHLDPSLSPIDATNARKLRISSLSRPILRALSKSPPDPLAVRAVRQSASTLVDSIVSLARQLTGDQSHGDQATTNGTPKTNGERGRTLQDAAIIMGGGVIRQATYRDVVLALLRERGVSFGVEVTVEDVAGEGVLGLVEKGRAGKA